MILTIVPALIQGNYMNRWGTPPSMSKAAAVFEHLPTEIGRFRYQEDGEPIGAEAREFLGLDDYVSRSYLNEETGERVVLLLMLGRPGPLVRHPPNFCYESLGMTQIGDVQALSGLGEDSSSQFNLLRYQQPGLTQNRFFVAYSHTVNGSWSAPKLGRLKFGGEPFLYKLQLLVPCSISEEASRESLTEFLAAFIPAFKASLSK
ncbi:exosortase-associated EpsI family protein [Blastopirellula marina]|nr:exosortase-associated EpsI family protein [Blastopirellula marina]